MGGLHTKAVDTSTVFVKKITILIIFVANKDNLVNFISLLLHILNWAFSILLGGINHPTVVIFGALLCSLSNNLYTTNGISLDFLWLSNTHLMAFFFSIFNTPFTHSIKWNKCYKHLSFFWIGLWFFVVSKHHKVPIKMLFLMELILFPTLVFLNLFWKSLVVLVCLGVRFPFSWFYQQIFSNLFQAQQVLCSYWLLK